MEASWGIKKKVNNWAMSVARFDSFVLVVMFHIFKPIAHFQDKQLTLEPKMAYFSCNSSILRLRHFPKIDPVY